MYEAKKAGIYSDIFNYLQFLELIIIIHNFTFNNYIYKHYKIQT